MASGPELAHAYVSVSLSTGGLGREVDKAFGGGTMDAAGEKAGSRFIGKFGAALKKTAIGAGIAAGGLLGKGLADAFGQSDATTKFKQSLDFAGISKAQIDQATKITQKYADDTVFDLSTVQNTAAQLAANGVKDFTGLTKAAGNLNAVAGGNADTFRGVAMALTQTVGAGKLTTENWNQIADAIPGASGVLQEALKKNGAFTGDFRDAMAKGQITAEEFNKALMEVGNRPIAVQAATSTATFEGAIGNLMATITGGFAGMLNKGKPQLTGFITYVSGAVGKGFEFVSALPGRISAAWNKSHALQNIRADMELLLHGDTEDGEGGWPVALHDAITKAYSSSKPMMRRWMSDARLLIHGRALDLGASGWPVDLHNAIAQNLADARDKIHDFQASASEYLGAPDGVVESWGTIAKQAAQRFGKSIITDPAFTGTIDRLKSIWGKLVDTGKRSLAPLGSIIQSLAKAFSDAFKSISGTGLSVWGLLLKAADGVASVLQKYLVPALEAVAKWMKDNPKILGAIVVGLVTYKSVMTGITVATKLWTIATGIATAAQKLLNGAMKANPIGLVVAAVAALAAGFVYLWNRSEGFRNFWIGLWDKIKAAAKVVSDWFTGTVVPIFVKVWNGIKGPLSQLWDTIKTIFGDIKKIISGVVEFITGVFTGKWSKAWDGVKKIFGAFFDWIKAVGKLLLAWFGKLPGLVISLIGKGASALGRLGKDFLTWVWDGIKAVALNVWSWFTALPGKVVSLIGRGVTALTKLGQSVLSWIWNGIKDVAVSVWSWFTSLPGRVGTLIGEGGGALISTGGRILGWIWQGIKNVAVSVWGWFSGIAGKIGAEIDKIWKNLTDIGKRLINYIVGGIVGAAKAVWNWVSNIPGWLVDAVVAVWNRIVDVGKRIVAAVVDGINAAGPLIKQALDVWSNPAGTDDLVDRFKATPHATGGNLSPGWNLVGEQGPELIHKSGASAMVFSNSRSKAMVSSARPAAATGATGGTFTGNLYLSGGEFMGKVSGIVRGEVSEQVGMAVAR